MKKFCKVLITCPDCGPLLEVYGPFKTEKTAKDFDDYVKDSIFGSSCLTEEIVEMND